MEEEIQCNHGVQNGIYCECDEGWMSSGIHEDDPLIFHWCDTDMVDRSGIVGEPVKLSKPVEIVVIVVSGACNGNISLIMSSIPLNPKNLLYCVHV